jgi:hypothetical protein
MTLAPPAMIACSAGLCASAAAQSFTTDSSITMTMSWREATSTGGTVPNPDGILEPGESALILIDSVSFTNQGGTANFSPPISTFTSGIVSAFGNGFVEIEGSGGTQGLFNNSAPLANSQGTSGFGVRSPWRMSGNGTVNATGIANLQFGFFTETPGPTNPILNMFRLLWTPADYSPREAQFAINPAPLAGPAFAAVYLDFGNGLGANIYLPSSDVSLGSVSIPISPAPPTLALAAAAATLASRRRPQKGARP